MNNFIFENKTKVYFGRGCVKEYLASLLRGCETVMFAYGCGSIKKNGIYDEVLYILQKEGKTIVEFPGIAPNPSYEKVMEGIQLARENKVELILGVGGGSVMDCCKAVALGAVYEGDWWDSFWKRSGILDFSLLPLGVIVTSGGSGSECNGTVALMKSIIRNLKRALKEPENYEARSNLLWASALVKNRLIKAGKRGDFICRQMERKLEAYTGCHHGDDCAVLRPAYYRQLCQKKPEKFARFAVNVWEIPAEGKTGQELAEAGVSAFREFIRELRLPGTLRELGVREKKALGKLSEDCIASPGSYQGMDRKEISRILEECF